MVRYDFNTLVSQAAERCLTDFDELYAARESFGADAQTNLQFVNSELQNLTLPELEVEIRAWKTGEAAEPMDRIAYRKEQIRILDMVDTQLLPAGFKNDFEQSLTKLKMAASELMGVSLRDDGERWRGR